MSAAVEGAWCVVVPYHARAARLARHRLAGALTASISPELLADAVAVVAELVGNAIRHASPLPGDVIRVAWRVRTVLDRRTLEVRVTDGGAPEAPRRRDVGPDSVDGRGLAIVAALAERWGVEQDGLGQSVWAELVDPLDRSLHVEQGSMGWRGEPLAPGIWADDLDAVRGASSSDELVDTIGLGEAR